MLFPAQKKPEVDMKVRLEPGSNRSENPDPTYDSALKRLH